MIRWKNAAPKCVHVLPIQVLAGVGFLFGMYDVEAATAGLLS